MSRPGFALLAILLVIAAIELLTLASLALATHESVVVNVHQLIARARRTAVAELRRVERSWTSSGLDTMPIGQHKTLINGRVSVTVRRHSAGLFELIASAPAGRATLTETMILRTLDYLRGLQEINEAVLAAGPLEANDANVRNTDGVHCTLPDYPARPPGAITVGSSSNVFGLSDVVVDSLSAHAPSGYALAGVRWAELEGIADSIVIEPLEFAMDTTSPARLWYSPGRLTLLGGAGAGLLFVDGDLTMLSGVVFTGIVVVRGTASLASGARVSGTLRIQGAGVSRLSAEVIFSRCTTLRALRDSPATSRLVEAQRRFIPTF